MSDAENTPKSRWPWGRIALFVSLALNLAVAGLVVGALVGGPRDRDRSPPMRDLGFGPFAQALPVSDKFELTRALRAEAGSFRENRAALRTQFRALLDVVRAEPFDVDEAGRILSAQLSRIEERQQIGLRLLLEQLAEMSPEQRAAYADELDRIMRRDTKPRDKR